MGLIRRLQAAAARWGVRGLLRGKSVTHEEFEHFFIRADSSDMAELWGTHDDKDLEGIYKAHAIVRSCVQILNTSFLEAPLTIGRWEKDTFKVVEDHPMLGLVQAPNKLLSYGLFMNYFVSHLVLTGKSFVWEWRLRKSGEPAELWPLPTSWVDIERAKGLSESADSRVIRGFTVTPEDDKANAAHVDPHNMVYARSVDPSNLWDGVGPLQAALKDWKTDDERANYIMEMLKNLKVPGLIIHQEEDFTTEQREDIRATLADVLGKGKRGNALLVGGEKSSVEVLTPLKDLDWPGLSNLSESRLCGALGVPPLLVHARVAQENSPLSAPNIEAAERVFFRMTMTALWTAVADVLTHALLRDEGEEELEFRFDLSGIAALQEDIEKRANVASILVGGGIIEVNEGRELAGYQRDPKRDGVYLLPVNMVEIRAGEDRMLPAPEGGSHGEFDGDGDEGGGGDGAGGGEE